MSVPRLEGRVPRASVMLINPFPRVSRERVRDRVLSPSLGLHSLASMARKHAFEAEVFDCCYADEQELYLRLRAKRYDFIGVSFFHATLQESSELLVRAKDVSPTSVFLAGGQEATFNFKEIMGNGVPADIIIKGLGEFTLLKVLRAYPETRALDVYREIPGLILNLPTEGIWDTGPAEALTHESFLEISKTLDYAQIPYRDSWERFEQRFSKTHLRAIKALVRTIKIYIGNYCPMGCDFCASTHYLKRAHDMPNPGVAQLNALETFLHIRRIADIYPEVEAFYFNDDNITIDRRKLLELARLLEAQEMAGRFRFFGQVRTDMVDEELLQAMGSMGFHTINYGVESFSDRMLETIAKKNQAARNESAIRAAIAAGVNPLINLILFPPEIEEADLCQTIDKCLEFIRQGVYLFAIAPYVDSLPGSRIHTLGYDAEKVEINIPEGGIHFFTAGRIWPINPKLKRLALESYEQQPKRASDLLAKHPQLEQAPELLSVLALFHAIYGNLGKPDKTSEIESISAGIRI